MKLKHYCFVFILVLFDQLTKYFSSNYLSFYEAVDVISPFISFVLVHNYGAAYGIFENQRLFLTSVAVVVIVGSIWFQKAIIQSVFSRYALVFLLAGALGNVLDRVRLGYVVDFIDITIFPVFNVADIFINIAMGLFLLELIYGYKSRKKI